jgi:glycosyltransferase involved in cell wall biosynthesis
MRFLMICMRYPVAGGQSWLTTELADALLAAGHDVEVLLVEWNGLADGAIECLTSPAGVRIVRCAPRQWRGLGPLAAVASKFILTGRNAAQALKTQFDLRSFDAAIAWMPTTAIAPVPALLRRAGIAHRLLFIWDFFPFHHREIGRIPPGPPFWIARAWEQRLLSEFTAIICTLPGNADYLRRRFRLGPEQRILVTPIWSDTTPFPHGDRTAVRTRYGLPAEPPIAVFGGQLVEGRGFEQMLGAADAAGSQGSRLIFLFIGDGRLAPMVRERAERQANIVWLPATSRSAYGELLGACDVGMVATVPGVSSFSIPSKTVDYLRAGLPIVAAVEPGSDFAAILESYGVGRAVPFREPLAFFKEAERLATDLHLRAAAREAAPRCLEEVFDVRHAVDTIIAATV